MNHHAPQFDKEFQALAKARLALAQAEGNPLAAPYGELLCHYELLLERAKRVTELALTVQMELDETVEQVDQLSQVDGLTGALNRRSFERLLSRDWAQAQREGGVLSLVVANIDFFRSFNEVYGSQAGDDCLKDVAASLMRSLYREVDATARMEGDTFAVLLPGTDADGAQIVAERMLREVEALEVPHLESPHGGIVTVSLGVSTLSPGRNQAPMLLVRQAQEALGAAKSKGRATLVALTPGE